MCQVLKKLKGLFFNSVNTSNSIVKLSRGESRDIPEISQESL